jgi:hypothetical protein
MENYYELNRESFSSISKLADGPKAYLNYKEGVFDDDKTYFRIGKLVDDLRCLDETVDINEYILQHYAVNTFTDPTAQSLSLAKYLIEIDKEITDQVALDTIKELGLFGSTKKEELLLAKYKEVEDYVLFFKNNDKPIISFEEYTIAEKIINSFRQDEFVKQYMSNTSTESIEYFNELPILWEIVLGDKKVELKSKLDKVIVNHTDKTIQPIDFKTTGDNVTKFKKSYIQLKYYYQAAMYLAALSYKQYKEKWLEDYTILPFKFIVETTELKNIGKPLIFEVPFEEASIATQNKGLYKVGFTVIKGWIELLEDLIWYQENGFEKNREYVSNGGKYELKVFE